MSADMPREKKRALVLVVDNRHTVDGPADGLPEGWFEEEVGYAAIEPSALTVITAQSAAGPESHD